MHAHVRSRSLAALLALAALSACGSGDQPEPEAPLPESAPTAHTRNLDALAGPSSWTGQVPCADCAGIETVLTLYPDGTYRSQGAYLGTGGAGDTINADFGRWTHADNGSRVQLHGAGSAPGHYAVDSDGALRMLDAQGRDMESNANYRLTAAAAPVTITHPSRLVGAFTYMADAAIFVECESGLQFPVHMSADYRALESAYASARGNGQPVVVRLKGHLDVRNVGEGDGRALALVVDSMDTIQPHDGCAAMRTLDTIAEGEWRLITLADADSAGRVTRTNRDPVAVSDSSRASFSWNRGENRIAGSGGCNQYTGRGVMRGTMLVGAPAAATKMACAEPGVSALEQRFLGLLGEGAALRIDNDTLVWSQGPRDVARFVRR